MSEQLAWAAGLFDGEGGFYSRKQQGGRRYALAVVPQSGSSELLEKFQSIVGIGSIFGPYKLPGNRRDGYQWRYSGYDGVEQLYRMLSPWLGTEKIDQGLRVLEICVKRSVKHSARK